MYRILLFMLGSAGSGWTQNDTWVTPQEDTQCVKDGHQGVCRLITVCDSAKRDLNMKIQPQICTFKGLEPVVCCFDETQPVATTAPAQAAAAATEQTIPSYEYEYAVDEASDGCQPIPTRLTSQVTGRKAWDKCIEYQIKYVYPCEKRLALGGSKIRVNYCGHNADELNLGGIGAKPGEFPHMVLLGYGNDTKTARWLCGGTILSEKFVLTAAHCYNTRDYGPVKYVRVAMVKRSDPLDPKRLFNISRIILHPEYQAPKKYNDIAILEIEIGMSLDRFAMPACLPVGDSHNDSTAVAIGFGAVGFREEPSNNLQKVVLNKFSTEDCSEHYPPSRLMNKGFLESTQSCYGDKAKSKDTCHGDSGGPLHIDNKNVHCMYTIVGVISFGIRCGFVGVPGIYTRVAAYVPWIESIVWP